jgi:hypothetical protein
VSALRRDVAASSAQAGVRCLFPGHRTLLPGFWAPVAGIVKLASDLLIHGFYLYSFLYHDNLDLVFSKLFSEFKHIFREYLILPV